MLHELQVHQIELEMQNEELRRAQTELEASRARYFDLYDMAPVGYFTVSEQGLIQEANLAAAGFLGVTRGDLAKQPLSHFIVPEDQDIYYRHRKQLFETGTPQTFELRMMTKGGVQFWARLDSTIAHDIDSAPMCRVVMSDITARKQADALRQSEQLYRSLVESIDTGITLIDPSHTIVAINSCNRGCSTRMRRSFSERSVTASLRNGMPSATIVPELRRWRPASRPRWKRKESETMASVFPLG